MHALLKGILFGLLLAVLIGPVFFALLQTSIHKGFRSGLLLAIGISLSDTMYVVICYVGFLQLFEDAQFQESLAMAGGMLMLMFGFSALLKPVSSNPSLLLKSPQAGTYRYIIKGFALNAINPFVVLFWVGVMSMVSVQEKFEDTQVFLFFVGTIITVFLTDIAKAYVAHRLSKYLTHTILTWMNRGVGIALLGFGVRLIFYAFKGM